jgi:hypothetical protein
VPQKEALVAGAACGGLSPTPPRIYRFGASPDRDFIRANSERGMQYHPLDRSRPLSRRSGCLPVFALSSAQSGAHSTAAGVRGASLDDAPPVMGDDEEAVKDAKSEHRIH